MSSSAVSAFFVPFCVATSAAMFSMLRESNSNFRESHYHKQKVSPRVVPINNPRFNLLTSPKVSVLLTTSPIQNSFQVSSLLLQLDQKVTTASNADDVVVVNDADADNAVVKSKLKGSKDVPFPKHGLTLKEILKFIEKNGGKERFKDMTTTQVCDEVLKVATKDHQCSYCELLLLEDVDSDGDASITNHHQRSIGIDYVANVRRKESKKDGSVGKAEVFVSHAWKYKFLDVVSALEYHFKDTPDIIIWFDLFSNNQHGTGELPFEWWATTFKSAIQEMGRTVMVLAPW
jgi:hypothetical protein